MEGVSSSSPSPFNPRPTPPSPPQPEPAKPADCTSVLRRQVYLEEVLLELRCGNIDGWLRRTPLSRAIHGQEHVVLTASASTGATAAAEKALEVHQGRRTTTHEETHTVKTVGLRRGVIVE